MPSDGRSIPLKWLSIFPCSAVYRSRPFFIRAPWIERVGPQVELLAEREGHGVLVRQGLVLASSFHPELTADDRLHELFVGMVRSVSAPR